MGAFAVTPLDLTGSTMRAAQTANYLSSMRDQNKLRELSAGVDFTNPTARNAFASKAIAIDPQAGAQYMQLFASMDEQTRQQAQLLAGNVGRTMLQIKKLPPEQQASAYAQAQQQFPDALMEPYDPSVIDKHISDAQTFDQAYSAYQDQQKQFNEAPKTRTIRRGSTEVTQEWNPQAHKWNDVASGNAFAPQQPTETDRMLEWLNSGDPTKKKIAEHKLGIGGSDGTFAGTGIDAQSENILLSGDPSTPEYALAYQNVYGTPQMVPGTDDTGHSIMTPIYLQPPPNIRKPTASAAPVTSDQPMVPRVQSVQSQSALPLVPDAPAPVVPAGQVSGNQMTATPLTVGISSKRNQPATEDQRKNAQLYGETSEQLKILTGDGGKDKGVFDALADNMQISKSAVSNKLTGNATMFNSEDYQRGLNAVNIIAADYLYSVSGATANPGETANRVNAIIPQFNDQPGTIADKKARVAHMVQHIKDRMAAGIPDGQPFPDDAGDDGGDISDLLAKPADQWTPEDIARAQKAAGQ